MTEMDGKMRKQHMLNTLRKQKNKRKTMHIFWGLIVIVGIILLAFAQIGGIGYFLYLWGNLGVAVGTAAWIGFKLWAGSLLIGVIFYSFGMLMLD